MPASLTSPSANGLPLITGGSASVSPCFEACSTFTRVPARMVAEPPQSGPLSPECFRPFRYLHDPPWLLPTGATVVGRGSHPPEEGAFPRRTVIHWGWRGAPAPANPRPGGSAPLAPPSPPPLPSPSPMTEASMAPEATGKFSTTTARGAPSERKALGVVKSRATPVRHQGFLGGALVRLHRLDSQRRKSSISPRPFEAGFSCSHWTIFSMTTSTLAWRSMVS